MSIKALAPSLIIRAVLYFSHGLADEYYSVNSGTRWVSE